MNIFSLFFKPKPRFSLPDFLIGIVSEIILNHWIDERGKSLRKRDLKNKKCFASSYSRMDYKNKIYEAILKTGLFDPYTGDKIDYSLICKWNSKLAEEGKLEYKKLFAMLPSVDHKDPDATVLEFEICTWKTNECKSNFNPEEFIAFCSKVLSNNIFTKNNNTIKN